MSLQRLQALSPGTCKCCLVEGKSLCRCDSNEDLDIGSLLWIVRVGPERHRLYHRWVQGSHTQRRGCEDGAERLEDVATSQRVQTTTNSWKGKERLLP